MSNLFEAKPKILTVRDVAAQDFVEAYAKHLKKQGKIDLPRFVEYAKTGNFKELAPLNEDWYYIRCGKFYKASPSFVNSLNYTHIQWSGIIHV